MEFKKKQLGDLVKIEILGGIDNESSEELKSHFNELMAAEFKEIEIDLFNVPFITSSGIGKFLLFYKNIVSKGKKMKITRINDELLDLFKSIKLDKLIPIETGE
jgi:anti-anti-sigma factor